MITLKALNSTLIQNTRYSYLKDNVLSGVNIFYVVNVKGFLVDNYVLIGEFGPETSESFQITAVDETTNSITINGFLAFPHSESIRVSVLDYNKVGFFYTLTNTFSADDQLPVVGDWKDIQPYSVNTSMEDMIHAPNYSDPSNGGFGWFVFYNSTTGVKTQNSNSIPYTGFDSNTVRYVLDSFYSLLNTNEYKLIKEKDALVWLNEAYTKAINSLNLVNDDYNSIINYSLTVLSGLQECSLPTDFGTMISIYDENKGTEITNISVSEINSKNSKTSEKHYYLRAGSIGLTPVPTANATYKITYKVSKKKLLSYDSVIDLPNGGEYALKDFMLYRAAKKLNSSDGFDYYKLFNQDLDELKLSSTNQTNKNDSWSISSEANI